MLLNTPQPIDDNNWKNISKRFEANINNSNLAAASNELFNGNINLMITTIMPPVWSNTGLSYTPKPQGTAYKYDQLNRLTEMQAFQNIDMAANLWKSNAPVYKNLYHNKFTYDANGNILKQERNDQSGNAIENMTYRYAKDASARCIQNRLYHINEDTKIKSTSYIDDIDDQGVFVSSLSDINVKNNYTYDELGNLTSDRQEGIANIKWKEYVYFFYSLAQDKKFTNNFLYYDYNIKITKNQGTYIVNFNSIDTTASLIAIQYSLDKSAGMFKVIDINYLKR